ncbi:MAG: hypothetical protein ACXVBW_14400 [Bdellovibrionota bacterium]
MLAALLLLVSASAYATDRPKAEVLVRAPHEIPGLSIDEGRMEVVPAHDPEQVLVILRGRFLREGWVLQASPGDFRAPRPVSGDFELAIPVRAHDRVVSIELQAQSRLGPGESEFLTLRMPEITRWFRETSIWLTSGRRTSSVPRSRRPRPLPAGSARSRRR